MSRMLQFAGKLFQRLTRAAGNSVQHERDMTVGLRIRNGWCWAPSFSRWRSSSGVRGPAAGSGQPALHALACKSRPSVQDRQDQQQDRDAADVERGPPTLEPSRHRFSSSGSLAMLTAIRRASSLVSRFISSRRIGL